MDGKHGGGGWKGASGENNLMDPKRITFLGNIVFGSLENDFEWVGERDFFL